MTYMPRGAMTIKEAFKSWLSAHATAWEDRRHFALMEELWELRVERQLTRPQADAYVADWCVKWRPFTFRAQEVERWSPNIHDVIDSHGRSIRHQPET